jgi:hypothetical protein
MTSSYFHGQLLQRAKAINQAIAAIGWGIQSFQDCCQRPQDSTDPFVAWKPIEE